MDSQRPDRWALYERHHRSIAAYFTRRVERDAVDDLVAETFAVAWRRLPRHDDDALPWLYGVARMLALAHHRGRGRQRSLLDRIAARGHDRAGSPDPAELIADDPRLARAFARLTPAEQEALRLTAWEGLESRAAAAAAGCRPNAFAVRLSRARAHLARELAAEEEPPAAVPGSPRAVPAASPPAGSPGAVSAASPPAVSPRAVSAASPPAAVTGSPRATGVPIVTQELVR
jgi:RNA polymerase sigma factor (sigma-70 family)